MYCNRRFMQKKIVLCSVFCLIALMVYIVIFVENHNIAEKHFRPFSEKCLSTGAGELITEVCLNYTKGVSYGSLCKDLCVKKTIKVISCIQHMTTLVFIGENNEEPIVIKKKRTHSIQKAAQSFEDAIRDYALKKDINRAYRKLLEDHVKQVQGEDSKKLFIKNFRRISQLLFGKQLEELTLAQMKNSWNLVGQDELIILALHQNLNSFPKLKGTCGSVYAMESIQPLSKFFPQIQPFIPWLKRAIIAKSFLNLIKDFENSGVGRLHHCDMQEANFGITKDLKVKAIDVDLIYSRDRLNEILRRRSECWSDGDCDFFNCNSKCDLKTNKCNTEQTTNNLMIMCRDIFYPERPKNGLLTNFQPLSIKKRLSTLLEDCRSSSFGKMPMDHYTVQNVLKELERILNKSLKQPKT